MMMMETVMKEEMRKVRMYVWAGIEKGEKWEMEMKKWWWGSYGFMLCYVMFVLCVHRMLNLILFHPIIPHSLFSLFSPLYFFFFFLLSFC